MNNGLKELGMLRILKRLESGEKLFAQCRDPDPCEEHHRRSFQKLSEDDLQTMRDFLRDAKEGIYRPRTERESAAFAAYNAALELECKRAGCKSREEFKRLPARRVKGRASPRAARHH